ncbi:MAG: universal stress protein [Nitrospiraceae bacterium]|nr:MAG: universal stress protein [Nitrospiraceae bacterium]
MKNLMKKIEDALSAVSFAEAGEHEKAREIIKSHKTVLLAISDTMFDKNAFRYALNTSQRVNASLEILYMTEAGQERRGLKDFLEEVRKEGFKFSIVMGKGCVKKAILDYTDKRNDILFVVVGASLELNIGCEVHERSFTKEWKNLRCPLVVVSKNDMPPLTA